MRLVTTNARPHFRTEPYEEGKCTQNSLAKGWWQRRLALRAAVWRDCIPGSEIIPVEVAVSWSSWQGACGEGVESSLATSWFCGMVLGSVPEVES